MSLHITYLYFREIQYEAVSPVISSQVGSSITDLSEPVSLMFILSQVSMRVYVYIYSDHGTIYHIIIFTLQNYSAPKCGFWNFSLNSKR